MGVKVTTGKKKSQWGKSVRPALRPIKPKRQTVPIATIRRIEDHAKLMAVKTYDWKELRPAVDSGAGESVIPPTEAENVPSEEGDRIGCKYEVANGGIIRNLGQRRFAVATKDGGL